jgi:hypothetical protein
MNKLSILYRSCNLEINGNFNVCRPCWFDKRKSFKSFYNSFGDKEGIDIYLIYDGNENEELYQYISKFKLKHKYLIFVKNNEKSLLYCYNLMSQLDSEFIASFEDDYLWLPNSDKILLEGLEKFNKIATISLYHHPDRLIRKDDVTWGQEYIFNTNSCYWRTSESNTATFAISKELFNKYKQEFINCSIHDRLLFINLLKNWGLRHLNPISEKYGCTHVNKFFFSFFIDWEKYNNSIVI